jgi:class 3 adenylate cyclase
MDGRPPSSHDPQRFMRKSLPSGTVTFVFTDIEGSTRLLHELGNGYADALAEHRRILRDAFFRYGGPSSGPRAMHCSWRSGSRPAPSPPRSRGSVVNALIGLAGVAVARGNFLQSARILGAADALREQSGVGQLETLESRLLRDAQTRIVAALDEEAFAAAWQEGGRLTADEAVALALESLARLP